MTQQEDYMTFEALHNPFNLIASVIVLLMPNWLKIWTILETAFSNVERFCKIDKWTKGDIGQFQGGIFS